MREAWHIPRMWGRGLTARVMVDAALREGRHVHRAVGYSDMVCAGGDPECPLFALQLKEAMEAWSGS